ncbi:Fc receptor-like protein 3 isoform X1 [Arapaima gigas]
MCYVTRPSVFAFVSHPSTAQLISAVTLIAYPGNVLVEEDALNLTCVTSVQENYSGQLDYSILKDDSTVASSTQSSAYSLLILNIAKSDAGLYRCTVTDPTGLLMQSDTVLVTVADLFQGVVLKLTYGKALVMEKEPQTMTCEATVNPLRKEKKSNVKYTFLKMQQPVAEESLSSVFFIASTQTSDAGQYTCAARLGKVTKYSKKVPLRLYDNLPKALLTVNPPGGAVYTGDMIELKCDLDQFVGWRYYWYKDKKDTYPVQQNWGSRGDGATYALWRAAPAQTGLYWCRAGRGTPLFYTEYSDPLFVNVTDLFTGVTLTTSSGTVAEEGQALNLTCEVQLSTSLVNLPEDMRTAGILFTFLKDEEVVARSFGQNTYHIPRILSTDAGVYICVASSGSASKRSQEVVISLDSSAVILVAGVGTVLTLLVAPIAFLLKLLWTKVQQQRGSSKEAALPSDQTSGEGSAHHVLGPTGGPVSSAQRGPFLHRLPRGGAPAFARVGVDTAGQTRELPGGGGRRDGERKPAD